MAQEYPFDDNAMEYSMDRRQYLLKKNYVLGEIMIGEDVIPMLETAETFRKLAISVSNDIYRFIYRHSLRSDLGFKQYMLAKDKDLRQIIKWAMLAQMEFYLTSGGGALKNQHGVDIERSKSVDLFRMRGEGYIAPQAIDYLYEGANILNTGRVSNALDDYDDGSY